MINLEIPDRPTIGLAHPLKTNKLAEICCRSEQNFKAALNFKSNSERGKQY
jgi:hypothetical protein